jgi:hypothetical protein
MSDTSYDRSPAMMAARGQTYGKRKQQEEAQRAVPMRRPPTEIQARQAARRAPLPDFFGETRRPDEPITAGAPFGPGPGAEVVNTMTEQEMEYEALQEIRNIYRQHPSQALLDIIQFYEESFE